jgi:cyclase
MNPHQKMLPRVIPCLLISGGGVVKTVRYRNASYVGDPINILRILNDKEVDEILVLDIDATPKRRRPNIEFVEQFASECFMPMAYGGGITSMEDAERLFAAGVEKVCLNTAAVQQPELIRQLSQAFGSQSVVVSLDIRRSFFGKPMLYSHAGRKKSRLDPAEFAKKIEELGAGEIFVSAIDRDGTWVGYDLELISMISRQVGIPVIASGGAGKLGDFKAAIVEGGASAVSAGSFFVYQGPHRAVLVTYPNRASLKELFHAPAEDQRTCA